MAAARAGLRVFEFDRDLHSVKQVRAALTASQCKSIWFNPTFGEQNNLLTLRKSIPELYECDC